MPRMNPRRRNGSWYVPGRLYDLAFGGMFRGLKRGIGRVVVRDGLFPWLDVCCGTGSQFRGLGRVWKRGSNLLFSKKSRFDPLFDLTVCGLDNSLGFIRYAAARAPQVPFVCADAACLPFKAGAIRAVSVSFGLHDKSPDLRRTMMAEARRVLAPGGRLIAVDFENPWNARSRVGALFARAVERLAGGEHYRNSRDFLKRGGLRVFLRENGFVELSRRDVATGSISVVVAKDGTRS
jgi:ubiquinone/menaquinone biosynthesis C-methylase UbiE